MVVELAAVRVVSPWFGSSHVVWSNVIGVVLLALTLGYVIGGRLALGIHPVQSMGRAMGAAAMLVAVLPFFAEVVCGLFMPGAMGLDQALSLFTWGSLAASVLLFLPPALLLGTVSPLATEAVARLQDLRPGQAGGRVLAAGTLGSLVGVFSTSHLLLPILGVRGTFILAAGLLLIGATVLLSRTGSRATAALLWFLLGGTLLLPQGLPGLPSGMRLLGQVESSYQTARIVESGEGPSLFRRLVVNEALDSFQSVWSPVPGLLGGGHYYDLFTLPIAWDNVPPTWHLLVLGLGAGTGVRVLQGALPPDTKLVWTGVEIDPAVVTLGQEHMDLEATPPSQILSGWDARIALQFLPGPFDQIILDSYANNMEIPFHLATKEFFELALLKLRHGGWLTLNGAGFGVDDPLIRALGSTMARAAGQNALILEVPFSRNCMILVRSGMSVPDPRAPALAGTPDPIRKMLHSLGAEGTFSWMSPHEGDLVLTDDRAPMEQLQRSSIARGRDRWARGAAQ